MKSEIKKNLGFEQSPYEQAVYFAHDTKRNLKTNEKER